MPDTLPLALPFSNSQREQLEALTTSLDGAGLLWLGGYLTALGQQRAQWMGVAQPEVAQADPGIVVTVLYGSQTGHARRVATDLFERLGAAGQAARLCGANDYPRRELKDERCLLAVVSTQGDGDPPDHARDLLEFIQGKRAPRMEAARYAVLALGDSSYPHFCVIGHQLDARLEALGATRLSWVAEADVDVETFAEPWIVATISQVLETFREQARPAPIRPGAPAAGINVRLKAAEAFTRARPYRAEVSVNQRITGRQSERDVRHVELLLHGSGLTYEPGDSLGVWPTQAEPLVDEVLELLRLGDTEMVEFGGTSLPLRRWLTDKRELTVLTRPFLAAHAERSGDAMLRDLLDPSRRDQLAALMQSHQLADLLAAYPANWTAPDLVAALRPLAPRLYSIASSPLPTEGDEVHVTVAHVAYCRNGVHRWGAASRCLADRADGDAVDVFVEPSERFRLPADPGRDIIMIGPGTGVAPFRAFVQHRAAIGAAGRNWLFFGNRHFRSEFLYQTEWQAAIADSRLHRLSLAFSRDKNDRAYVQNRMEQHGAELYDWVQSGAYVYVCGDASRMAPDVHAALKGIAMRHGGLSEEAADQWLIALANAGRYLRDVY